MWLSRKNSFNSSSPTSPTRRSFNRHSFKNIEDLFVDDDKNVSCTNDLNNDHQPQKKNKKQPTSPSPSPSPISPTGKNNPVLQRVYRVKQFTLSKPVTENSQSELNNASSTHTFNIPGADKRIVVYMTSIRAVRPTFEACRTVRSILQGFRVKVDERDLSMDPSFKDELQKIRSEGGDVFQKNKMALPCVFVEGSYLGDAEEVRQMNETGELKNLLERLPVSRGVCEGCGDFRFIICNECNGSRKCYKEKKGVFRSCTVCNKNGLVRCPTCWTVES